ncbi:MAG: Gfo/Idh/MocA family oxidoreductase [Trueperaceae bacterium]
MQVIRLAVIGCGRAAESLHLPAAAVCTGIETTVLVDTNRERARSLAEAYEVREVRTSAEDAWPLADAAVVALPHHLHAPVTRELLEANLHVLVEKPLALRARECEELAALAQERGLTLAVGMIRRSFPAIRFVKRVLERALLGEIERVELREGSPFSWEVASDFTFRSETGGGVLADSGVHVLDLLSWWFAEPVGGATVESGASVGPATGVTSLRKSEGTFDRGFEPMIEPTVESYRDDSHGGVEAECEIELGLPAGAKAFVELSRTRELSNSVTISGSRGTLTAGTGFAAEVSLDLGGDPLVGSVRHQERNYQNVRELFVEQLVDFRDAVKLGRPPFVGALEARRSVRLLERCRAIRQPLRLPWVEFSSEATA